MDIKQKLTDFWNMIYDMFGIDNLMTIVNAIIALFK